MQVTTDIFSDAKASGMQHNATSNAELSAPLNASMRPLGAVVRFENASEDEVPRKRAKMV